MNGVKGLAMEPAIARVNELRERGKIEADDLDLALEPRDLELLETGVLATLWYPIEIQDRYLQLICEVEAGGDERYLAEFGEQTARRVLEDSALQLILAGARGFRSRAGVALVKMASVGFSFGHWSYLGASLEDFTIEATEVSALPESVRHNIAGFTQYLASTVQGVPIRATSERPTRDRVVFRGRKV